MKLKENKKSPPCFSKQKKERRLQSPWLSASWQLISVKLTMVSISSHGCVSETTEKLGIGRDGWSKLMRASSRRRRLAHAAIDHMAN